MYGGYYAQGVVKDSPHPNCAKLWIEHILSDEGALGYLRVGRCRPASRRSSRPTRSPPTYMKNLPAADLSPKCKFLTQDQITKANRP